MSSRKGQKRANQLIRAQQAAERRRRRTIWISAVAVLAVLLAGGVTGAIYLSRRNAQAAQSYAMPAGATRTDLGVPVSNGGVDVDIYLDYMCPHCKEFETLAAGPLNDFSGNNTITLTYHPLNYLNRYSSGTEYSTRSAAAAGCAADAKKLPDFTSAIFGKQPAENSKGLTNQQILSIAHGAGITGATFDKCVTSQKYAKWVTHVSNAAQAKGVQQTPTVFVDGKQVDASVSALTNAINAAA
jgi:protein-disulfide isomerase